MDAVMLTDAEAERYEVKSVSRHEKASCIYFCSVIADGLPNLLIRVEYIKRTYDPGYYKQAEVRQGSSKVPVRFSIESIFARKVDEVVNGCGDLREDLMRKMGVT